MDSLDRLFGQRGREVGEAIQSGLSRGPLKLIAVLGVLPFLLIASVNAAAPQPSVTSLVPVGVPVADPPQCPITTLVPSGDPVATLVVDVHANNCPTSCPGPFNCCSNAASVNLPAGQYLVTMSGQECSTEGGPCNYDGTPGGPGCLPTSAGVCSGETGVCFICAAGHPAAGTVLITHPGGAFRAWRNDCYSGDNFGIYTLKFYLIYNFSGFSSPVDNPGPGPTFVFNKTKAGSAIPVKFSLSGDQGLNIFAMGYPKSEKVDCSNAGSQDAIEETVTSGGSSLSYDATLDQYNYVWKTDKAWAGTCRKLIVRLIDGTDHVAYFNFTK